MDEHVVIRTRDQEPYIATIVEPDDPAQMYMPLRLEVDHPDGSVTLVRLVDYLRDMEERIVARLSGAER